MTWKEFERYWAKFLAQNLNSKSIRDGFVALSGTQVPTFPRGFAKDHEAIDLIRHKQLLRHNFTDKEVDPNLFTK
jgi:hypothetical protein